MDMLHLIATPIGDPKDISLRAIETLKAADVVIGEEFKVLSRLLKSWDITGKSLEQLNEHSDPEDVARLLELCRDKSVALVSDCGTPGFCDPGARLVRACRDENVAVTSLPGASSLMVLLSLLGRRADQFYFQGFLPAEKEARAKAMATLARRGEPFVVMDTPYRLPKIQKELASCFKGHIVCGVRLTQPDEQILDMRLEQFAKVELDKAEFIALVIPEKRGGTDQARRTSWGRSGKRSNRKS